MHIINTLSQCAKVIASVCLIPNLEYRASIIYAFREGAELGLTSCTECCDVCVCVEREGEGEGKERWEMEDKLNCRIIILHVLSFIK